MKEHCKKIRAFLIHHVYMFSIIIIVLSLYFLSIPDYGYIGIDLILTNLQGRFAISIILIILLATLGFAKGRFRAQGFIKGFISGWPLLLVGILYFIVLLVGTNFSTYFVGANALALIAIIFDMFCTGLFEEVLMRGIIYQSMIEKWGNDRNGHMKSMIISSAMFGLMHLLNYTPELLVATISQIIFTTFIGMFLCSVFTKSGRNMWVIIMLHAVFDFITLILQQQFVYTTVTDGLVTDMSLVMGLVVVMATLPLGLLGIRNIKRQFH